MTGFDREAFAQECKLLGNEGQNGYLCVSTIRPVGGYGSCPGRFYKGEDAVGRAAAWLSDETDNGAGAYIRNNPTPVKPTGKNGNVMQSDVPDVDPWLALDVDGIGEATDTKVEQSRHRAMWAMKTLGCGFVVCTGRYYQFKVKVKGSDHQGRLYLKSLNARYLEEHDEPEGGWGVKHDTAPMRRDANTRAAGGVHQKTGGRARIAAIATQHDRMVDVSDVVLPTSKARAKGPRKLLASVDPVEITDDLMRPIGTAGVALYSANSDGGIRSTLRIALVNVCRDDLGLSLAQTLQAVPYHDQASLTRAYNDLRVVRVGIGTIRFHADPKLFLAYVQAKNDLVAALRPEVEPDTLPLGVGRKHVGLLVQAAEADGCALVIKQSGRVIECGNDYGCAFDDDTGADMFRRYRRCDVQYCPRCRHMRLDVLREWLVADRDWHFLKVPGDVRLDRNQDHYLRSVDGGEVEKVTLSPTRLLVHDEAGAPSTVFITSERQISYVAMRQGMRRLGAEYYTLNGSAARDHVIDLLERDLVGLFLGTGVEILARVTAITGHLQVRNGTKGFRFPTITEAREASKLNAEMERLEAGDLRAVGGYAVQANGVDLLLSLHPPGWDQVTTALLAHAIGFVPRVPSRSDFLRLERSRLSLVDRYG